MKKIIAVVAVLLLATLAGCSTCGSTACAVGSVAAYPAPQPQKIMAVGYGALGGSSSQYTYGQQKLMAMRAARVDAYRALAEQVYGFRVWGNTAVSAFATQNDNVRTYVDTYIRGARVVNMTPIADGNYEATVELDLTPVFFSCLSAPASACATQHSAPAGCFSSGCVQPSAYYYSPQ